MSFKNIWWHMWVVVNKSFLAGGVVYKPLVTYVDRRSHVFGASRNRLQAFGGIRGSSLTS